MPYTLQMEMLHSNKSYLLYQMRTRYIRKQKQLKTMMTQFYSSPETNLKKNMEVNAITKHNSGPPVVPQVNEYLKYITIDSIDEGNRKILEFGQRTLVKFNSMGRKKSIDVKKSMNSCTSSLKIQVHEENGNALLEEEIQLDSDSESEESIKHEIETKLEREERALNTSCCSQSKCSIM